MKLDLSIEKINFILGTLGKLPYEQSFQLIQEIQQQAKGQIESVKEDKVVNE